MSATRTYPGVYIEEVPSGVRTIVGVATSITAFVGRALRKTVRGPADDPVRVQSFAEFERVFGGLWDQSTMSYAVHQYFLNGGTDAIIVRVHRGAAKATVTLPTSAGTPWALEACSEGTWGNSLRATVDYQTKDATDADLFNLTIEEMDLSTGQVKAAEVFRNLSIESGAARYAAKVLAQESAYVRVSTAGGAAPTARPDDTTTAFSQNGSDGQAILDAQISDANLEGTRQGLWALEKVDLFNLLCIPPLEREQDIGESTLTAALAYCKKRRAMLLVDPPAGWASIAQAASGVDTSGVGGLGLSRDENAALYFPRVKMADPLKENRLEEFVPCGVIAGVFARTDAQRGVWKAPAGLEASLIGVRELSYKMTDGENGQLNPLAVNCLRSFPVTGMVCWGARTLEGADRLASEWKYVPVRRLALYLEESLYRGTQWVVFEPNDEPLWSQIRLNVGAFMHNLFRQGAFQGRTPREAYFVKCDKETTTQNDIDLGIVNILVGFAPLKPAEFVVIKIQQIAGQVQA